MEFDRYRDGYSDRINRAITFGNAGQDFYLRAKAAHILRLVEQQVHTDSPRILDVGCGIGLVHSLLEPHVRDLVGVDVAPKTLAEARRGTPVGRFVRYDGSHLPFPDESFDVVFAVCVMHHVPPNAWAAFAAELSRVTRSGGLVAIFEHNPLNPLTQYVVRSCELDDDAVLLGRGRVRRLLEGSGLTEIEQRHILFFPWEGGFWRSVEDRLGWLPLGAQYLVAARKGGSDALAAASSAP